MVTSPTLAVLAKTPPQLLSGGVAQVCDNSRTIDELSAADERQANCAGAGGEIFFVGRLIIEWQSRGMEEGRGSVPLHRSDEADIVRGVAVQQDDKNCLTILVTPSTGAALLRRHFPSCPPFSQRRGHHSEQRQLLVFSWMKRPPLLVVSGGLLED